MAGSVEPYRWELPLCDACTGAARDRPKGGRGCRCRITQWRARWRTPAHESRSKNFRRKRDAEAHISQVETAKYQGNYIDEAKSRTPFGKFAHEEWAPAQEWKETTRQDWPAIYRRIEPHLGSTPLGRIDQLMLKAIRRKLSEKYAHDTVKLTMAYIGMVLRAAYANGYIGRDPTAGLRSTKAKAGPDSKGDGRVTPDQVPTRDEALAILDGARDEYRAGIALGLSGLRVGEVLGMAEDRIGFACRSCGESTGVTAWCSTCGTEVETVCRVTVDQQMQRVKNEQKLVTPKNEKVRTIIVPERFALEVVRHLREMKVSPGEILFHAPRGAYLIRRDQFYDTAWKPALEAAGLPRDRFVFHSLRHWCASTLLAGGASLTATAGHLGDTVETVTRVYAHWLRDDQSVPADVLNLHLRTS